MLKGEESITQRYLRYAISRQHAPLPVLNPRPVYRDRFAIRRVRDVGHIKWQGSLIFLSEMLCHELVGLLPLEGDRYEVYFGPVLLGELDMDLRTFTRVR